MSLGRTLQTTIDTLAAQNLARQHAADAAALAKVAKETQRRDDLVNAIIGQITDKITAGLIPTYKIDAYDLKGWVRACQKSPKAPYYGPWQRLMEWAARSEIALRFAEDHDGCGMTDWITVHVSPVL